MIKDQRVSSPVDTDGKNDPVECIHPVNIICVSSNTHEWIIFNWLKGWENKLLRKILNKDVSERISNFMPVNYDCMQSIYHWENKTHNIKEHTISKSWL